MFRSEITVKNTIGIHGRLLTFFLDDASKYKSSIWVKKEGEDRKANAKSMMGVLSLNIYGGERIQIIAEGPDEQEAVEYLISQIENDFKDHK